MDKVLTSLNNKEALKVVFSIAHVDADESYWYGSFLFWCGWLRFPVLSFLFWLGSRLSVLYYLFTVGTVGRSVTLLASFSLLVPS